MAGGRGGDGEEHAAPTGLERGGFGCTINMSLLRSFRPAGWRDDNHVQRDLAVLSLVVVFVFVRGRNPFRVGILRRGLPRVARGLATLGFVAESLWDSSLCFLGVPMLNPAFIPCSCCGLCVVGGRASWLGCAKETCLCGAARDWGGGGRAGLGDFPLARTGVWRAGVESVGGGLFL